MECFRVYNSSAKRLKAVIEPWGNEYDIPAGHMLKVEVDKAPSSIEIDVNEGGIFNLYVNGASLDLDGTGVVPKNYA